MADEKDLVLGPAEGEDEPEMVYDPLDLMEYLIGVYQFLDTIDIEMAGGPKTRENIMKAKKKCLELILATVFSL